jgi:hypothetical protein
LSQRRIALILAALIIIGVVGAAVLAVTSRDDDGAVAGPDTTTSTTLPLSDTAEELLEKVESAQSLEYHVRLEQVGETAEGSVQLEVWRRGSLIAQSLVATTTAEDQEVTQEARSFQLPDGNVYCARSSSADWTCYEASSTATEAGEPAGLVEAAAGDLGGKEVTSEATEIGGHDAVCYTIVGDDGTSEICVTDEGIPVALSAQGARVEVTTLERSVDDEAFEPPAEITTPTS